MADPAPVDGGQAQPVAGPDASTQALVAQVLGQAGAAPEPGRAEQASASPKVISGKQVVKWGDTTREVDVEELVRGAMDRATSEQAARALQQAVEKQAGLKMLDTWASQLSPIQQKAFHQILQNPTLLDGLEPPEGADEDDVAAAPGGSEAPASSRLAREVREMKRMLMSLAERAVEAETKQRTSSLAEQVTAALQSFTPFKLNPDMLDWAREQMMLKLAQEPDADMTAVAAQWAARLEKLSQQRQAPPPAPREADTVPLPSRRFTGQDLLSGRIRAYAEQFM